MMLKRFIKELVQLFITVKFCLLMSNPGHYVSNPGHTPFLPPCLLPSHTYTHPPRCKTQREGKPGLARRACTSRKTGSCASAPACLEVSNSGSGVLRFRSRDTVFLSPGSHTAQHKCFKESIIYV